MKREDLILEIKKLIVSSLELEDVSVESIKTEEPLFVKGLGLDSIDALELGMALKKKYDLNFKNNKEDNKEYFYSVATLADFIAKSKNISLE